jgi:hypothetical protein
MLARLFLQSARRRRACGADRPQSPALPLGLPRGACSRAPGIANFHPRECSEQRRDRWLSRRPFRRLRELGIAQRGEQLVDFDVEHGLQQLPGSVAKFGFDRIEQSSKSGSAFPIYDRVRQGVVLWFIIARSYMFKLSGEISTCYLAEYCFAFGILSRHHQVRTSPADL